MKATKDCVEFIASYEGWRDHPYRDSGGVWTIGYGHTGSGVASMGKISHQKGLQLLAGDAGAAEKAINALGIQLNQNQFDAIVSAVFNCGPGILQPGKSLGDALRKNGMAGVPAALAKYVRDAHGTVLLGLQKRRAAEAALFTKPVHDGPATWLTPTELRRCQELDELLKAAHPNAQQQKRIAVLVRALTKQRKRIWQSAQDTPKGDGHGWDHGHRRQRYRSLLARTA